MTSDKVTVDDMGYGAHTGHKIAIRIDRDGHLEFAPSDDSDEMWIHPRALVAALKELGVLADDTEKPPAREWPSDRVRESWRKAAADDQNERPEIEAHAYRRRLKAQQERQRLAKMRGARYFRDRDGDEWRSIADGRVNLWRTRSGMRVDVPDPRPREWVDRVYGPLKEVPDPFAILSPSMEGVRPSVSWVDETRAMWQTPDQTQAAYVARLREQVRRDINSSVWRRF